MTDFQIERRALVNALRHAAELYAIASAIRTELASLLSTLQAARSGAADALAAAWSIDTVAEVSTPAERDDVERRAASSLEALADLVDREERNLQILLKDLPTGAVARSDADRLTKEIADARRALLDRMLMLTASAERPERGGRDANFNWKPATEPVAGKPAAHIFRLWYGTNRDAVMRGTKLIGYGTERSEQTHYGQCDVTIPETHRIGSIGSRWWQRIGRGDDRLVLDAIQAQEEDIFWEDVRERLHDSAEPGDAILFIHGYNVSFEDAAIRAAQIGADLSLGGAMAFFSWASRGRILGYIADETTIEASEPQITQFLIDFIEKSGARAVHVIAHSMGNRGLLRAIQRIAAAATARTTKPLGQIILAAPDIDTGTFRALAAAYPLVAARTTLYVSEADLAVRASRLLHGADRIGFAPPIAIVDGIDTVNVTGVDLTLLGHGYVGESRSVLQDMYELLARGTAPTARAMLRQKADAEGRAYWEVAA